MIISRSQSAKVTEFGAPNHTFVCGEDHRVLMGPILSHRGEGGIGSMPSNVYSVFGNQRAVKKMNI